VDTDVGRICVIQKEYPTAGRLGKTKRQHWDIAVIDKPLKPINGKKPSYDYLKIHSAIEFGLNEDLEHLEDDIIRLCHAEALVKHSYIIHLYRISDNISNRDLSVRSKQVREHRISIEKITSIFKGRNVVGFVVISDSSAVGGIEPGIWKMHQNSSVKIS
jgi:hypothetical protein